MKPFIAITALAMAAPNGLDSVTVATSVWSDITRVSSPLVSGRTFDPLTLGAIPDQCFFPLKPEVGQGRNLSPLESRLIGLAGLLEPEVNAIRLPGSVSPHFIVGLPDTLDRPEEIAALMAKQLGLNTSHSMALPIGRAAGLMAVHEACRMIESGSADIVIAGGIDSYNDIDLLGILHSRSRIKADIGQDQFIPGEGACLVCLMAEQKARASGLTYPMRILSSARGFEPGHIHGPVPCLGTGLSETLREVFTRAKGQHKPVKAVFSSMNGESFWAREWGMAFIRNMDSFHDKVATNHPAQCYGDPGAAAGPLMIGCALKGYEYNYFDGPAIVYASSDGGERAAVLLDGGPNE